MVQFGQMRTRGRGLPKPLNFSRAFGGGPKRRPRRRLAYAGTAASRLYLLRYCLGDRPVTRLKVTRKALGSE